MDNERDNDPLKVDDFRHFLESTAQEERHFLSKRNLAFLEALYESSKSRVRVVEKGTFLYRARVNTASVDDPFSEKSDVVPKPKMKTEGRVNPYNVCVLYLANRPEVAVAEVRPGMFQPVTVAKFEVVKDLEVVDFSRDRPDWLYWFHQFSPSSQEDNENFTWIEVNRVFSKPLMENESRLGYIPTQIISEYFKSQGYDGITYESQFSIDGIDATTESGLNENYALFDLGSAKPISGKVYKVTQQLISVTKSPNQEIIY